MTAIIAFLQSAERLKDTLRSGRTAQGRSESTAEHSWRLCLMIMAFERDLADHDIARLLKLAVVHDLGEAIHGDTPATEQHLDPDRNERERRDMAKLCALLPDDISGEMLNLWDDYAGARSPEARLVKGFDKLETMLQHLAGRNASDFNYAFNLSYGTAQTNYHPLLRDLRAIVDGWTRERIDHSHRA
ncbi:HD domain-containing protein [Sphingomonas crocodyli]|uniref:HD domain-containing protein n=1 Tax=Sphingomonas crocodyli TaxID=1979270 RepID=A0A437LYT2_9SPHN|nr:HD domain-containing protein [Sphingomonas crocodyli]